MDTDEVLRQRQTMESMLSRISQLEMRPTMADVQSMVQQQVAQSLSRSSLHQGIEMMRREVAQQAAQQDRLATRVDALQREVENLTNVIRQDERLAHVESQLTALLRTMDDRLARKVDQVTFDSIVASRARIDDVQAAMHDKVTLEHVDQLASNKADVHELRAVENRMSDFVGREEVKMALAAQIRPLLAAVAALEKAQQLQQHSILTASAPASLPAPPHSPSRGGGRIGGVVTATSSPRGAPTGSSNAASLYAPIRMSPGLGPEEEESYQLWLRRVRRVVADALREHEIEGAGHVTHMQLQMSTSDLRESVLRQVRIELDNVRAESAEDVGGQVTSLRSESQKGFNELRERNESLQAALERTQTELVRALNKKAYKSEVTRALQDKANTADVEAALQNKTERSDLTDLEGLMRKKVEEVDHQRLIDSIREELRDVASTLDEFRRATHERVEKLDFAMQDRIKDADARTSRTLTNLETEWRQRLSDLGKTLEQDIANKMGRDDVLSTVQREAEQLTMRLAEVRVRVDEAAQDIAVQRLETELSGLNERVAGELTGGRWLWRSGRTQRGGWVPWELQAVNGCPDNLRWSKNATSISLKVPGLYHVVSAFFTSVPSVVQVCLNGEPVLTLEPLDDSSNVAADVCHAENQYIFRRSRHNAGDVTCLTVSEYLALPECAILSVRFVSPVRAQGFLSIRKL